MMFIKLSLVISESTKNRDILMIQSTIYFLDHHAYPVKQTTSMF